MKNKFSLKLSAVLLGFTALVIIAGCGSSMEILSKWKTQSITIDGKNTEWEGGVYLKDANAVLNVYNDASFIYLGIISSDRQLARKIIMNGLTVWLDRNGSEDKDFGIHFPLGAMNQDMPVPEGDDENSDRPEKMGNPGMMGNPERMDEMFMKGMAEYEIMGKGGKPESRLQILEKNGIEVKIGRADDKFVYELKMPMKIFGDILYAVGTDTGKTISLGFETGTIDLEKMKSRMGQGKKHDRGGEQDGNAMGDDPQSMGAGPMGGGRPQGGGMGRNSSDAQKAVSFWAKVHLASAKK